MATVAWGTRVTASAAGEFLRTLDWVDPDRMAIFGAAMRSYLTVLAATSRESLILRIARYGDFNMLTLVGADPIASDADEFLRPTDIQTNNPDAYRAGSPIYGIPHLKSPTRRSG